MTNDTSLEGNPADEHARNADATRDDWESTALKRVAARHGELNDARGDDPNAQSLTAWEERAIECLKRYFRAQR